MSRCEVYISPANAFWSCLYFMHCCPTPPPPSTLKHVANSYMVKYSSTVVCSTLRQLLQISRIDILLEFVLRDPVAEVGVPTVDGAIRWYPLLKAGHLTLGVVHGLMRGVRRGVQGRCSQVALLLLLLHVLPRCKRVTSRIRWVVLQT